MFQSLGEKLTATLKHIRGLSKISEDNIKEMLREVRVSLLEADVALPVIQSFLAEVHSKAIGQKVQDSLNPSQTFLKIIQDELQVLLGGACAPLQLNVSPPAVILMAGLQGSGKTTTTAKLAKLLQSKQNKRVMVASTDIYRPAAIEQLEKLAQDQGLLFFPSQSTDQPIAITLNAIEAAKKQGADVLIIDTAGRLHVDDAMMAEVKEIAKHAQPIETLFVIDSMTGQDAVHTAKSFNEALELTGLILIKADGDSRGGVALSAHMITGKPIKYVGVGEKIDALELFYPDRMASRILGMGDILSLIEEAEEKIDKTKTKKIAQKIKKGVDFDFEDFRDQLQQMNKMGGMMGILSKIPGMGQMPAGAQNQATEKQFGKIVAMINSMTIKERRFPSIISGSRKRRIAEGSGNQIQDVNRMLKQFEQMQKMMKKFSKPGMLKNLMRNLPMGGGGMGGMGGGLPGM